MSRVIQAENSSEDSCVPSKELIGPTGEKENDQRCTRVCAYDQMLPYGGSHSFLWSRFVYEWLVVFKCWSLENALDKTKLFKHLQLGLFRNENNRY